MTKVFTHKDVSLHSTRDSCHVIIHNKVYNLTNFLSEHPGGARIILREAGTDATAAYSKYHPAELISNVLSPDLCLGVLDTTSVPISLKQPEEQTAGQRKSRDISGGGGGKPDLASVLNVFDFEAIARKTLSREAWVYYSSGSGDEITLRDNRQSFNRIAMIPRVLVNVSSISTTTRLLGSHCAMPIYISSCALGKLGHPEGEVVLTRAAGTRNVIQMMPTLASCGLDEMLDARRPKEGGDGWQDTWFQLYVNSDREVTKRVVQHAEKRGCKGLFVTVDAPWLGRREKDMRVKYVDDAPDIQKRETDTNGKLVNRAEGAARAISSFIDSKLAWSDLSWLASITSLPIVLKGIQCAEDAVRAARTPRIAGIVVSNHGGRQLDTSRSGIEILPEVMDALNAAGLKRRIEVFVDGGVRRGTDVFKALALGAAGVGIGRPTLYAMSTYGQAGVERLLDIFKEELEGCMGLMGVTKISEIRRDMVDTKYLGARVSVVKDFLHENAYEAMEFPTSKL
ncbi:hypothetical protein HK100_009157 [Physocladia obscura]|uniref:L-lactate dehydrogenase (cytochrome) n=1 Tax=Physocladia obscura TaxID=109957 RepID=A0AAD5XEC3_9FUNG|nr:hypothetical protein HK100_009157 [Physocladia obscura]